MKYYKKTENYKEMEEKFKEKAFKCNKIFYSTQSQNKEKKLMVPITMYV